MNTCDIRCITLREKASASAFSMGLYAMCANRLQRQGRPQPAQEMEQRFHSEWMSMATQLTDVKARMAQENQLASRDLEDTDDLWDCIQSLQGHLSGIAAALAEEVQSCAVS